MRPTSRLLALQIGRPFQMVLAALLTMAVAGYLAAQLELLTSFGELLPRDKESVLVAEEVSERLASASTLTIVAEGKDPEALKRFVDEAAPKVRALGPDYVGTVDEGAQATQDFLKKHRFLYAPLADVQKVRDDIVGRYEFEVRKAAGFELGLDDDDPEAKPPEPITRESLTKRFDEEQKKAEAKLPGGYYLDLKEGRIVILVRTSVSIGDSKRYDALLSKIRGVIHEVDPKSLDPAMTVTLAGDLITGAEEYDQIKNDLSHVGELGVAMILGVVFLFYLRLRTLLAMTLTVAIGVLWTFGFAYLAIGHLNSSTGFLVSIIVGNGINFSIIFMARYLEERRSKEAEASVAVAVKETWLATLSAAGAAMIAYGSLVVTDFRGFKHFGVIGGAGMLLCWCATYLFLPAILMAFERVLPLREKEGWVSRLRGGYGRPFAWLVVKAPRAITVFGVVLGLASVALSIRYVLLDPMEYDMSNTRNEPKTTETTARQLGHKVEKIVGRQGQDGVAIMVDRLEQVVPLQVALHALRDAAPKDDKPFDKVVTVYDLLPKDQAQKIALVNESVEKIRRAHRKGFLSDKDYGDLQKELPEGELQPLGVDDIPEQMARSFIEKDGTRGRLVYMVPATGKSVWDAHYLITWAESFRRTELPDGSIVRGSGRSVIFADMILAVVEDAPKAILASLLGTIAIVVLAFRGRRGAVAVSLTLLLGIACMAAFVAIYHSKTGVAGQPLGIEVESMKLNFLNFVALPISIGVGADYAVNVVQRYLLDGEKDIRQVVIETGGAVILCSLTTVLGYFALTYSVNRAIVSFGVVAAAGEVACLLAAVLVLPAALRWKELRLAAKRNTGTKGSG
jgi:predicted RND superfamily exporter protein